MRDVFVLLLFENCPTKSVIGTTPAFRASVHKAGKADEICLLPHFHISFISINLPLYSPYLIVTVVNMLD